MGGKRAKGAKLISSGHFFLLCLSFYQQKLTARIEVEIERRGREEDGWFPGTQHARDDRN